MIGTKFMLNNQIWRVTSKYSSTDSYWCRNCGTNKRAWFYTHVIRDAKQLADDY